MPTIECPRCSTRLGFEESLEHLPFEHGGVVPASVVMALWGRRGVEIPQPAQPVDDPDPRRQRDHFSPSMASGCMREYMLERTTPQAFNPYRRWQMLEGTLWHEVLSGYTAPGWESEVPLPSVGDHVRAAPGLEFREKDGVLEFLWEGMWLSGRLDQVLARPGQRVLIEDFKTQASPVAYRSKVTREPEYYPPNREAKVDHATQLNLYRWMYNDLKGLVTPPALRVWLYIKGIQKPEYAWTPQAVQEMTREEVVERVRPHYELFTQAWREWEGASTQAEKDLVIARMPLQGRPMFNKTKCVKYCGQKGACDNLLVLNPEMAGDDV